MARGRIELLGDVAVVHDGHRRIVRGVQARAVLALLVERRGRSVSRHEIADVLWPDRLPDHWSGALRGVVAKVRATLAATPTPLATVVTTQDGWCLELAADADVDLELATSALERAERLVARGSSASMTTATSLARGAADAFSRPAIPGATVEWVERLRADIDERARRSWSVVARAALAAGDGGEAVRAGRELLRRDPYDERALRWILRGHAIAGERDRALTAFDEFAEKLADDLGARPDPSTSQLVERLRHGPSTARSPGRARSAFVGRDDELARLVAHWQVVVESGRAHACVVSGESGAGKTRLVEEFLGLVDFDATVLWGACSPDERSSYHPILMALPDLGAPEDLVGEARGSDEFRRFVVFREIASRVEESMSGPTVLVVDDVQWIDEDTRALIGHLGRVLADRPVLWVLTSRIRSGVLDAVVEALSRSVDVEHLELGGLDVASVASLLRGLGVGHLDALAAEVQARSSGNPFYVEELGSLVDEEGRLDAVAVPASLLPWMRRRLGDLDEPAQRVLGAASVLGMEVDVELLVEVVDGTPWEVLDACERLLDARWFDERSDGTLTFRHALTREAVESTLSASRRAVLHEKVASALERRPGVAAASLARHLSSAGAPATDRARAAALDAGDEALATSAWSSAVDWYERAATSATEPAELIRALVGSGRARRGAGDRSGARVRLERARQLAINVGDGRSSAAATLGLVGGGARGVSDLLSDAERSGLLRGALDLLGPGDDDLVIRLELELALALVLTDRVDERHALLRDALERARALAQPELLVEAILGQRIAMVSPEHDAERVAMADEAVRLSRSLGRQELLLAALAARGEDALLLGDRALADDLFAEASAVAARHDHPYWRWVTSTWSTLTTIIDGDLDAAEAAAFAAVGFQPAHPEAMACLGVNLVDIRLFQGRSGEMVELLRAEADANPHIPCYRAVLALCAAEAGDLDAARRDYEHFAASSFTGIPHDSNRLLALVVLADVAATLADRVGAAVLLELLVAHQHRQALLNCFGGGGAYWGPVAMHLARLAALVDDDRASSWTAAARRSCEGVGANLVAARIDSHREAVG